MSMTDNEYAAMNLRTIKENIAAYASFADCYYDCYDKIEAAQNAVQELINCIENGKENF